jgi:hypothetical protein
MLDDNNEKKEMGNIDKLFSKMINRLNEVLERYMSQYPRYNELKAFMQNEDNLYDENGALKEDYKEWIKDVEKYSCNHSIKETLKEFHEKDPLWPAVFEGIERYVNSNLELLALYEKAKREEGPVFDSEEWIYNQIKKSSRDESEANEKFNTLADMFSNETLNLLDKSSELRKILKERVEKNGTE